MGLFGWGWGGSNNNKGTNLITLWSLLYHVYRTAHKPSTRTRLGKPEWGAVSFWVLPASLAMLFSSLPSAPWGPLLRTSHYLPAGGASPEISVTVKILGGPGRRGSVDWVPVGKLKGRRFDSQSGHMPGLWARSAVGGLREAADLCVSHTSMFLSLSFSFSTPLSKNKKIKSQKKKKDKLCSDECLGLAAKQTNKIPNIKIFNFWHEF